MWSWIVAAWAWTNEHGIHLSAAFTAIATVVIAFLARTMARANRALQKIGEAQLSETKILQRAFLTIYPGGVETIVHDPQIAKILIKNSGNLPATNVRWVIHSALSADRFYKGFDILANDIVQSTNVLAPKGEMLRFQDLHHSNTKMHQLQQRSLALYVWGIVYYSDGFTSGRWTKFCHRYESDCLAVGDSELRAEHARQHQYGNGTDQDETETA
jgi:hypothetical protein